jgi:hypothetical protein
MTEQPIRYRSRILALFGTPFYVMLVAAGLSGASTAPFWLSLLAVIAGAGVIMVTLCVFGVKAYRHAGPTRRFGLSTMFLVIIPLSVYLAGLRWGIMGLPVDRITPAGWITAALFCAIFIVISTAVLLRFTEAVLWLATAVLRALNAARRSGRAGPEQRTVKE